MIVLGIETSCDETSIGIVRGGEELLSCVTASSMDIHSQFGGVVPEIAAREHIKSIIPSIQTALKQSKLTWRKIDAIAVTNGAGLGGSLLVGVLTARTLAITKNKPLYAINHVEAHIYANFLTSSSISGYTLPKQSPNFPLLGLIVSGGHTQLVLFSNHFDYQIIGQTYDDAIGEAFDKVAKILGLPYPGGPAIAKIASKGNPKAIKLPISKMEDPWSFSFSGLKTAVLRAAQKQVGKDYTFPSYQLAQLLTNAQKADIAASFQYTAIKTVVDKTVLAYNKYKPSSIVIAGGVAANQELRNQLSHQLPCSINYIDPQLCTDNGAMVATLGCYKAKYNTKSANPYTLDIAPNLSM